MCRFIKPMSQPTHIHHHFTYHTFNIVSSPEWTLSEHYHYNMIIINKHPSDFRQVLLIYTTVCFIWIKFSNVISCWCTSIQSMQWVSAGNLFSRVDSPPTSVLELKLHSKHFPNDFNKCRVQSLYGKIERGSLEEPHWKRPHKCIAFMYKW